MLNLIKICLVIYTLLYTNISLCNVIDKIEIQGNIRLDDQTIFSYLNLDKNSKIYRSDLNILFKDLFATELFSEIKFELEETKLIILLEENPIINRIALEGNRRLDDDDIFPEISLKIRDVFTKSKIQSNPNAKNTTLQSYFGVFEGIIYSKCT